MNKNLNNNKGMTLVEVLMALVILTVVMFIITTIIVQSYNVFETSTDRMSSGQLVEMTLREISDFLKASRPIDTSYEPHFKNEEQEWEFNSYNPNFTDGVLYRYKISKGTPDDINRYYYKIAKLDESIEENALISRKLPEVINSMSISFVDNKEIIIEIQYTDSVGSIAYKTTSVRPRNY